VVPIGNGATNIHRPERTRVEIFDAAEMRQFLDTAYGVRMRLKESRLRNAPLRHARTDIGPVAVDDVRMVGEISTSPDPLDKVFAVWANGGRVSGECAGLIGEAANGEITLLSQPDLPHDAHSADVNVTTVLMDPSLVAGVAGAATGGEVPLVRFSSFRPVDDVAARLWKDTVHYVKNSVLASDEAATPLVLGHCSRLLAAVTLATFPNTIAPDPTPHDRTDSGPVLLQRAISFMETNAGNDIALADIAEAVHVTPRAVQYMFRRHLDTTPLQYLRRLRLDYAHRDLLVAEHPQETVTAIAARWGFMHTGRFAVLYRQTFGQSPHETLRG